MDIDHDTIAENVCASQWSFNDNSLFSDYIYSAEQNTQLNQHLVVVIRLSVESALQLSCKILIIIHSNCMELNYLIRLKNFINFLFSAGGKCKDNIAYLN